MFERRPTRTLTRASATLLALVLALPLVLGSGPLEWGSMLREAEAGAPPANWTYRDRVHKFSFRMLRDYTQVPLKVDEKVFLCKFGDPKSKGSNKGTYDAEIAVMKIIEEGGTDTGGPVTTGGDEGPMTPEKLREMMDEALRPKDVWKATVGRIRMTKESEKDLEKIKKKFKKLKSKDKPAVEGKLWQFDVAIPSMWQGEKDIGLHVTLAQYTKDKVSIVLFMTCGESMGKQYPSRFKQIAKSFRWFDDKAKDVERIDDLDGVNITAKKRSQIERSMVKGWDVIVSPKKNYIVIYNTKNGKNNLLAKVIADRIEKIREQVYEEQFPPAKPIETVCIVRVCKDLQEYHQYGGPGGSAGYWSSRDEELVFYDASASKKPDDDTLSVLYHEAFHQYIYYSVGNVAPHSWFNEGHGDYYAGAKYKGGKFRIEPFDWRVGTVRNAITAGPRPFTEETDEQGNVRKRWEPKGYTPLQDLVRFTQGEYYSYPGVSYAQGWALIYFLREIVPKNKKYNEKWGHILDTYFDVLQREVNKDGPLERGGEGKDDDADDDDGKDGKGKDEKGKEDDTPSKPDTPTEPDGPPLPDGPTDPGGPPMPDGPEDGDGGTPDDGTPDDGTPDDGTPDEGPPLDVARVFHTGRGGPDALKKAVDEAFKDIDWEEFEKAWVEATKRGR